MADIQVENGNYTRIHNEILETLMRTHLSPLEFKLVLAIFRKTYGYHKTSDIITASQFREMTGASKVAILSALDNLTRLKVINRESVGQMYRYGYNKYHDQWLPETFESRVPNRIENLGDKRKNPTGKAVGYQPDKSLDTSKAVETGKAVGYQTGKAVETGTGQVVGYPQKKEKSIKEKGREKKSAPESPTLFSSLENESVQKRNGGSGKKKTTIPGFQDMFNILAEICKLDINLVRGRIAGIAKSLIKAGYTVEDIKSFAVWWKINDWRGKEGKPPTLELITSMIKQAKEESECINKSPAPAEAVEKERYQTETGEYRYRIKEKIS